MDPLTLAKKLDDETVARYEQLEAALVAELQRVQAVLVALGRRPASGAVLRPAVPTAIIDDIREYLRERGKPARQSEIIRAVGERRRKQYPELLRPFGDIWKSLQYHDKHDKEIVCVEEVAGEFQRAELKQRWKPPRTAGGKEDAPEHYSAPDNCFWFIERLSPPLRKL